MTARDAAYLLFSPSSLTHVREILASLTATQYLYRFQMPHSGQGNTEKIYTLGSRGRDYLVQEVGMEVDWWFRPFKVKHLSYGQIVHDLVLTRFCVAAAVWAAKQPDFKLKQTRICYELSRIDHFRDVTKKVIPDAWLLFESLREGAHDAYFPVILEIDRGRENQNNFKRHLRARLEFIKRGGEYSRVFGTEAVIIAYVTTGESERYRDTRLRAMRAWTNAVLKERGLTNWASIFRFHSLDLDTIYSNPAFDRLVWYRPDSSSPVQLFTL
jgi:hypothetical protein